MKQRKTLRIISYSLIIIGLLVLNYYVLKDREPAETNEERTEIISETMIDKEIALSNFSIDKLTSEQLVIPYLKEKGELPDYYITKKEARNSGWIASEGNLCDVLPGKAIGGDYFGNREKRLPTKKGRSWYEADLNYNCGRRNADRLLYSNDGLIFVTYDHYKSFEKR